MERHLYDELNALENVHWWHIAKRNAVEHLIKSFIIERYNSEQNAADQYNSGQQLALLDFGCGTGGNLSLLQKFGKAHGVDVSNDAVSYCLDRGFPNVSVVTEGELPFPDNSFDLVTLLDVLEHVDEQKTLTEIYRVLKPGGYLVTNVPAYQWLWSRWDEILHHKRRYTSSRLAFALESAGFTPIKTSYMFSYLLAPVAIVRAIKSVVSKGEYNSDFKLSSPLVNKIGVFISSVELKLLRYFDLPFGTSVISLAKKR